MDKQRLFEQLKLVFDPELCVNIVDLGLIYNVEVTGSDVTVSMTLTTPGCPMHDTISSGVERVLLQLPEVKSAKAHVVWTPPWSPDRMSDAAKDQLGYL